MTNFEGELKGLLLFGLGQTSEGCDQGREEASSAQESRRSIAGPDGKCFPSNPPHFFAFLQLNRKSSFFRGVLAPS